MKNFLLTIGIGLIIFTSVKAQNVGINATGVAPSTGAGLDVNFTDKGVLVPRVNIADLNTIAPITGVSVTSLLVYNTNATTGAGYYYWEGTKWIKLTTQGEDWSLTGNANVQFFNFLGTIDAQDLKFRTSNTERMRILSTGNVGIGTTVPTAQLHTTGTVRFANYPSGANGAILKTNTTGNLSITDFTGSASDVLLGTGSFGTANTSATAWQLTGNTGTTAGTNFLGTTDNVSLDFRTNNSIRMRILNSGSVGIGTTSPSSTLEVNGRIESSRLGYVGTYNSTQVQGIWSIGSAYGINTTTNDFGSQYGIVYAYTSAGTGSSKKPIAGWGHQILFTTNGTRMAAISLSSGNAYFAGNVGIGTTAPATKLHIQTTGSGEAFRITTYGTTLPTVTMGDDNSAPGVGYISLWLASTPVERVRLTAGNGPSYINAGNVGIGTTSPSEKLDVVGNVKFSGALMPNNDPGTSGKILLSGGSGAPPTWGQAMLNPTQTTAIGKYYSGAFDLTTTYLTLTLTDPNCVQTSTCFITWVGNLSTGVNYGDINVTIEAQAGQWKFHITNNTPWALYNLQFSYVAFY